MSKRLDIFFVSAVGVITAVYAFRPLLAAQSEQHYKDIHQIQAETEHKRRNAYTATQGVNGGNINAPSASSSGFTGDERKPHS